MPTPLPLYIVQGLPKESYILKHEVARPARTMGGIDIVERATSTGVQMGSEIWSA